MIKVIHPGMYSSLQDLGRYGVANYAIPQAGAMDTYAAKFANLLVGNSSIKTVLEVTLQGPKLLFEKSTTLACVGLKASVQLNGENIALHRIFTIQAGDILHIRQVIEGNYLYLACKNGFDAPSILGSTSFYEGVTESSKIEKGDILKTKLSEEDYSISNTQRWSRLRFKSGRYTPSIQVYKGPEFEKLKLQQQKELFTQPFHISKNYNRMAFQLEERVENDLNPILTSPVLPGTVQLTPDGKLIVLMKDAQTTGGYPRVLQLSENSISQLAQKRQKQKIYFEEIEDE